MRGKPHEGEGAFLERNDKDVCAWKRFLIKTIVWLYVYKKGKVFLLSNLNY